MKCYLLEFEENRAVTIALAANCRPGCSQCRTCGWNAAEHQRRMRENMPLVECEDGLRRMIVRRNEFE